MNNLESNVRSYSRIIDTEFSTALNALITDSKGRIYIDFLAGCGSLNYGHNDKCLQDKLLQYISTNGIAMSLDIHSQARTAFLESFHSHILKPRNLDYRVQFTGPTGANAIEASIKLARKYTNRTNIIAFTNSFHGCSLGALSLTANSHHRASSAALLSNVTRMPYDGYFGDNTNTILWLEKMLEDFSSGIDKPAAIILETIQGEGGLNHAKKAWMEYLFKISKKHKILTIIDDIQAGCGRSGDFFSFESFNIQPDIITIAKSISGFGLPMSLVLLKPELDVWEPGEHNGTFRGNNHAFITAKAAIDKFWSNNLFHKEVKDKTKLLSNELTRIANKYGLRVKGRGFMQGLEFLNGRSACKVKSLCYQNGLIIETAGSSDQVLKILCPLTIENNYLEQGLQIIENAINIVFKEDNVFENLMLA